MDKTHREGRLYNMARGLKSTYFEDKLKDIDTYNKNIKAIVDVKDINFLSKSMVVLSLWDLFMTVSYKAGNGDQGCVAEQHLKSSYDTSFEFEIFITSLHENRNKIAHIADDVEILVGNVADVLRSYKYYDILQKDLDIVLKGTGFMISAENIFKAFKIPLNRKYSIDGELPDTDVF